MKANVIETPMDRILEGEIGFVGEKDRKRAKDIYTSLTTIDFNLFEKEETVLAEFEPDVSFKSYLELIFAMKMRNRLSFKDLSNNLLRKHTFLQEITVELPPVDIYTMRVRVNYFKSSAVENDRWFPSYIVAKKDLLATDFCKTLKAKAEESKRELPTLDEQKLESFASELRTFIGRKSELAFTWDSEILEGQWEITAISGCTRITQSFVEHLVKKFPGNIADVIVEREHTGSLQLSVRWDPKGLQRNAFSIRPVTSGKRKAERDSE